MQLVGVEADFARFGGGTATTRWWTAAAEIRNLQEGFGITAKAADLLLYELVYYKPAHPGRCVHAVPRPEWRHESRVRALDLRRARPRDIDWEEDGEEIVRRWVGVPLSDTGRHADRADRTTLRPTLQRRFVSELRFLTAANRMDRRW
jgi:hypothetical protein